MILYNPMLYEVDLDIFCRYFDLKFIALPPDSYRDELWHLLFGLQIYISNLSKQNFILKKSLRLMMFINFLFTTAFIYLNTNCLEDYLDVLFSNFSTISGYFLRFSI